jgi:hypothetical protein
MPSPTLWDVYGTWVMYGILLALLALLGPAILGRSGARAFIVYVVLVWLAAAVVTYPVPFSATFWASHPGEASAGFTATAIGYGIPLWGAAICIWTLKRRRVSLLLQGLVGLAVGALLSPLSTTVALVVALVLIEGVLGIH